MGYPMKGNTDRLVLRSLIKDDWKAWETFMSDSESIRYFADFKTNDATQNAKNWIDNQLDRYADGTYGMHALIEKESNQFIGQCGLLTQEIGDRLELEIGYSLIREYWGKAFALEAASHMKNWAFKSPMIESVISIIKTDNKASQRVAVKNGMYADQRLIWKDIEIITFRANNPNFDREGYSD